MYRRLAVLSLLLELAACGSLPPRPPVITPPPITPPVVTRTVAVTVVQPDRLIVPGLGCTLAIDTIDPLACSYHDFRAFYDVPLEKCGFGAALHFAADGFLPTDSGRFVLNCQDLQASVTDAGPLLGEQILHEKPKHRARRGLVRLGGRTFVDDDGPFLAVGTTCFWCTWGFAHDRDRLEANLACAAGATPDRPGCPKTGVDYLRVLGVVGPTTWSDRTVDARDPALPALIAGLTDLAYDKYGIRIEWTIFGGVETSPTLADQQALVAKFIAMSKGREQKIIHWEVANEGTKNGFDRDRLWTLGRQLRTQTPILVALTAPIDGTDLSGDGNPANLETAHLDRDVSGTGGMYRPIRQARDQVGHIWTSNEPIGIDSSVAADSDPTRIVLSAIYTWICNGAAYVIHTGAGIRGGGAEDLARGRKPNFYDQPTFAAMVDGANGIRGALPADLPSFPRWENNNDRFPGYPFDTDPLVNEDAVLRAFCTIAADARMICGPIQVQQSVPFKARQAMTFDVLDPMTGAARTHVDLEAGQTYVQPPAQGVVFRGRLR